MSVGELAIGQQVGSYRLLRQLGVGGMGSVWLAATNDGREVALKLPLDIEYLIALRREASLTAVLEHPAIIRLLDIAIDHDPPYIAMEYVRGVTLRDALVAGQKLGEADSLRIIRQIAEALAFAHAKGVVHRDLKPENILIGEDGQARVLDFGLGKVVEGLAQSIALTGSLRSASGGSIVGTYAYMSPEQREGRSVGPEADVYTIGLILHESLTGTRPTGSLRRTLERHGASSVTIDVVCRCLEDPQSRFPDAGALLAELPSARPVVTPSSRPVETSEGLLLSHMTDPQTLPATDLSALALLPPPAADHPRRRRPWALLLILLAGLTVIGLIAYFIRP